MLRFLEAWKAATLVWIGEGRTKDLAAEAERPESEAGEERATNLGTQDLKAEAIVVLMKLVMLAV
jgi:hypothetical protein